MEGLELLLKLAHVTFCASRYSSQCAKFVFCHFVEIHICFQQDDQEYLNTIFLGFEASVRIPSEYSKLHVGAVLVRGSFL